MNYDKVLKKKTISMNYDKVLQNTNYQHIGSGNCIKKFPLEGIW